VVIANIYYLYISGYQYRQETSLDFPDHTNVDQFKTPYQKFKM